MHPAWPQEGGPGPNLPLRGPLKSSAAPSRSSSRGSGSGEARSYSARRDNVDNAIGRSVWSALPSVSAPPRDGIAPDHGRVVNSSRRCVLSRSRSRKGSVRGPISVRVFRVLHSAGPAYAWMDSSAAAANVPTSGTGKGNIAVDMVVPGPEPGAGPSLQHEHHQPSASADLEASAELDTAPSGGSTPANSPNLRSTAGAGAGAGPGPGSTPDHGGRASTETSSSPSLLSHLSDFYREWWREQAHRTCQVLNEPSDLHPSSSRLGAQSADEPLSDRRALPSGRT